MALAGHPPTGKRSTKTVPIDGDLLGVQDKLRTLVLRVPLSKFIPSEASLTPAERATATLDYLEKAIGVLRTQILATGEAPPIWVLDRLQQGAAHLGMACMYLSKMNRQGKTDKEKQEKVS